MKTHYNLEKLIKIRVVDFKADPWHSYKREKKIFGLAFRKEGIYSHFGHYFYPINEIETSFPDNVLRNEEFLTKPCCVLYFENNHTLNEWHDTYIDAVKRAEEIKEKSGKWLTIES